MRTSERALVDTNLIVYLYSGQTAKRKRVEEFVKQKRKQNRLFLAEQNLLEFYSVLTAPGRTEKPLSPREGWEIIKGYFREGVFGIIRPGTSTFNLFFKITKDKKPKGGRIFDFYLAATALSNGIEIIYTENENDFRSVSRIRTLSPFC